jgi:predicted nucleic acid-binding protein
MGIMVDSNVILDLFTDDPVWGDWSEKQMNRLSMEYPLIINPVIYTEVSIGFSTIEELESVILSCGFIMVQIPKEALFLTGKVFLTYRGKKGQKTNPLPDFYIGAHAAIQGYKILTRDHRRYQHYFPTVELIFPQSAVY